LATSCISVGKIEISFPSDWHIQASTQGQARSEKAIAPNQPEGAEGAEGNTFQFLITAAM
jgi:hypothetical protein